MNLSDIIGLFLPNEVRNNKAHTRYQELYIVASMSLAGIIIFILTILLLSLSEKQVTGYAIHIVMVTSILLSIRFFGHYRIPMTITAVASYIILYGFIVTSGYIYSPNITLLHGLLVAAIFTDKKYGWIVAVVNVALLVYIYWITPNTISFESISVFGNPQYVLSAHFFMTIFLGSFLTYSAYEQDKARKTIKDLQDQKIGELDKIVRYRTEQLTTMRQIIATDFHDETGNILAAITRQAAILEMRLITQPDNLPIVKSITKHSNDLYASSKDFLWNLNHNSDDPTELFNYLTSYGQRYYNEFDISFSSSGNLASPTYSQLDPFASLNIIYIIKEAMGNVIKHSKATEVTIEILHQESKVKFALQDNGEWLEPDPETEHFGIKNMEKRCFKNNLHFGLIKGDVGTRIEITATLNSKA